MFYFLGLRDDSITWEFYMLKKKKIIYLDFGVTYFFLCKFSTQWNSLPLVSLLSWIALLKKCQLADLTVELPIANYLS